MAAPRKRTARKTTTSRSRAPAKSGRSSASFLAMGMIAGLAVAILFYAIFIRQDANLSKGSGTQYAHTPNQPHLLNPLPPRPQEDSVPADRVAQTQSRTPAATVEAESQTRPPVSIAESTAREQAPSTQRPASQTQPQAPTSPDPVTAPKPSESRVTKAPTPSPSTPAKTTPAVKQPQPRITEDPIANLIAQNERAAKTPTPTRQATPAANKDDADHVGALLKTIPSADSTKDTTSPKPATAAPVPSATEKTIALNPVPTPQRPFYLQAGPYKTENEADAMRAQLLLLGHSHASVHKALVNNQTVYRVRIGPYTSTKALNDTQKALEAAKLKLSPVH